MSRLILLYAILILHLAGIYGRFYWTVPYYDILLHFLGGFWLALMAAYLLDRYVKKNFFQNHKFTEIIFLVGVTMIIGFWWEVYELLSDLYVFDKPNLLQGGVMDMLGDLTADFFGAIVYAITRLISKP